MASFGTLDFVVLCIILCISASIGLYYRYTGGKQKTTAEYLMGDRKMSIFPVSVSLMASFMSAISLLGVSNESYQFGTMFCLINVAYVLSTPIAAYLFLPVFYGLRNTSVYGYLERRFGAETRLAASLAYTMQMTLYAGIALYAPALALEAVTGISKFTAILVIGCVCTFYSTLGGMKAVLITEVLQSTLMFAAIYAVIVLSAVKAGGLSAIWQTAQQRERINFTDFSLDPTVRHTWWSLIIGGMVTYLSLYGVNQTQIQRLLSVRSLKAAQSALWWNLPILSCLSLSTLFSGLAIFYYYRDCDPVLQGRIQSRDQVMPLFAVDNMSQYPGLSGLFVSGIFSASLSCIGSAVNSLAAVTLEDYLKPLYYKCAGRAISEDYTTLQTKIMACIFGIICICLAFVASSLGGVLQASLTIFGIVGGPLLALFSLGIFTTRANQRGVLLALFLGIALASSIGFGGPKPPAPSLAFSTAGCLSNSNNSSFNFNQTLGLNPEALTSFRSSLTTTTTMAATTSDNTAEIKYFWPYRLSYLWLSVIGFLTTFCGGYGFSRLFERLKWADNSKIYLDVATKLLDYDLFAPPLSRRLRAKASVEMVKLNMAGAATQLVY